MIKKFLFAITILVLLTFSSVSANIMPNSSSDIAVDALGMYQLPYNVIVFKTPNEKSTILYKANWNEEKFKATKGRAEDIFTVFVPNKNLAFAQVTDFNDNWVEIIYDKSNNKKGWIQSENLRFMTWRNFMNTYGRRYGIYLFSDITEDNKVLYSGTDNNAQKLQSIGKKPLRIKFTAIKGNYILLTSIENNIGKTGYFKWRTDCGKIYAFPAIK